MRAVSIALLALCACAADEPIDPGVAVDLELPPHFPAPVVPADNPLTAAKIELGRYLFYDVRLSVNQAISCASCHQPEHAFADPLPVSLGATGEAGALNAPTLGNAVYAHPLTWAHGSITSIEEQLLGPMFGQQPVEMGMTGAEAQIALSLREAPVYETLFAEAFGDDAIDLDRARFALASFVRSLVSHRAPFDAFLEGDRGAISESARRGSDLFYSPRLNCGGCHAGFAFTAATRSAATSGPQLSPFHNIGLYDVDGVGAYPEASQGLIEQTGLASDMGRFRVPTLRNVALTGPYMHDGSVDTLADVIAIYERGGRVIESGPNAGDGRDSPHRSPLLPSFQLSDGERADLLAFLDTLTDRAFTADPSHADPW